MKNHCLFTKISCFPFFPLYMLCLEFHSMGPRLFTTFRVHLHCFSQVMAALSFWGGFLNSYWSLPLPHFCFLFGWTWIFFPFPVFFFTSLDPKVKRALTKLDCIALAEVKDVTVFKNLITPLAKFRTPELWSFWMIYSQEFLDSSSAFAMKSFISSVLCVCWAVWPLIWCLLTIWCLSNKTIGTISLWSIFFPSITKA